MLATVASVLLGLERRIGSMSPGARWSLAVGWYMGIAVLSHVPGTDVDSTAGYLEFLSMGHLNVLVRMAAHSTVFGVQATLTYLALHGSLEQDGRSFSAAVTITGILGLADEAHQHFVPLRHGRLADAVVDAVGGAVVLVLVLWLYAWLRCRRART